MLKAAEYPIKNFYVIPIEFLPDNMKIPESAKCFLESQEDGVLFIPLWKIYDVEIISALMNIPSDEWPKNDIQLMNGETFISEKLMSTHPYLKNLIPQAIVEALKCEKENKFTDKSLVN